MHRLHFNGGLGSAPCNTIQGIDVTDVRVQAPRLRGLDRLPFVVAADVPAEVASQYGLSSQGSPLPLNRLRRLPSFQADRLDASRNACAVVDPRGEEIVHEADCRTFRNLLRRAKLPADDPRVSARVMWRGRGPRPFFDVAVVHCYGARYRGERLRVSATYGGSNLGELLGARMWADRSSRIEPCRCFSHSRPEWLPRLLEELGYGSSLNFSALVGFEGFWMPGKTTPFVLRSNGYLLGARSFEGPLDLGRTLEHQRKALANQGKP